VKTILAIFLIVLLLLPVSAFGDIQTVTHTVKQPFGDSQSPDDARISAVAKEAKREASRFPYGVLYSIEPDRVYILAVMHLHRHPDYWKSRR